MLTICGKQKIMFMVRDSLLCLSSVGFVFVKLNEKQSYQELSEVFNLKNVSLRYPAAP